MGASDRGPGLVTNGVRRGYGPGGHFWRMSGIQAIVAGMGSESFEGERPALHMKRLIPLLVLLAAVPSASVHASDVGFNAYLGIPFDGSSPFFGANCELDPVSSYAAIDHDPNRPRLTLDLRYSGTRGAVMSLNGIPVTSPLARYASEDGSDGAKKKEIDWHVVAAAVLGAGLIAAVASSDNVRVSGCSGTNCPPEKPPVEPEPVDSEESQ